nr:hypothetical protein [Tanacetum cinerariifolium]
LWNGETASKKTLYFGKMNLKMETIFTGSLSTSLSFLGATTSRDPQMISSQRMPKQSA